MKVRVIVALVLFVISFSVVRAQEMIFYEPFDNTSTIDGNGGSYSGAVVFGNGVLGNSVQFSSFTIDYPVVDNLDINEDVGSCVVPIDGIVITEDTLFCEGSYSLPSGIIINASNVVLDCNGAVLIGENIYRRRGIGIYENRAIIKNCNITSSYYGIYAEDTHGHTITNNNIYSNYAGIYLEGSDNSSITDNMVYSNEEWGIIAYHSDINLSSNELHSNGNYALAFIGGDGIVLIDNIIHLNNGGIELTSSDYSNIINNSIYSNERYAFDFFSSQYNTLKNNRLNNNRYNFKIETLYYHYIDDSNTVNGKPVYYWVNQRNKEIPMDAGYVALINSTNISVFDIELRNNYHGILLYMAKNCRLENLTLTENEFGVYLYESDNNTMGNNRIYSNYEGIALWYSDNNTVVYNTINSNLESYYTHGSGIYLGYSNNNIIRYNHILDNDYGIYLEHYQSSRSKDVIEYNDILNNNFYNINNKKRFNVSAENNWWGTVNENEIGLMIYDYYDSQAYGIVDYEPYLYGPFDGKWLPIVSNLECQSNGGWVRCITLRYEDILTQIRVNCTDIDGSITDAVFELKDLLDYQTIFIGNGTFDSGYWVYDNDDWLLDYDGLILLATCVDNSLGENSLSESLLLGRDLIFYEGFDNIDSIYGNNGTVEGNIKFTETRCGRAGDLTSDSYISYPLGGNFPNATNLTIEFWFKNTKLSSQGFFDIARLYGTHPNSMGIFYSTSVNRVITEIRNNITGMYQAHAPGSLMGYKWNHVAMTFSDYNTENNCFMTTTYFNGNPGGEIRVCNFYPNMSNDFWVGRNYYYSYSNSYMDEFKIFNYAKSDGEIYNDYLYMRNCTKEDLPRKECIMNKPESLGKVKVNCSGLYVDDKPFTAKGVGYQPIPIGETANKEGGADIIFNTPKIYNRDFPLLRGMNANTIRTWAKVTNRSFLDAAWNSGVNPIYVLMGFWINCDDNYGDSAIREKYISNFTAYVNEFKDHPAVLAWAIGNEVNLCGNPSYIDEYYTLANDMAKAAYESEGSNYHPVGIVNWDIFHIGLDIYNSDDESLEYLDFWASNVYPGETFGTWFDDYSSLSGKPLLITEYGIDALNNTSKKEYEDVHAEWVLRQWNEINTSNVTIGSTLMAYSDEWWKSGNDWGHDYGGYTPAAHPDNFANEEWWGVMRIVRNLSGGVDIMQPREVYYALRNAWGETTGFDLPLNQGWNLISIPLILPDAPSIINYTIFGYNGSWFVPEEIDSKLGYWIKVDEPMIISFNGVEVTNRDMDLNNGWNLVGHPYLEEKNVSELFANDTVYGYNGSWSSYVSGRTVNSLESLEPGYGYWVNVEYSIPFVIFLLFFNRKI